MGLIYTLPLLVVTALLSGVPQGETGNSYVGPAACAACHPDVAGRQSASRHAKTWMPAAAGSVKTYTVELEGQEPFTLPVRAIVGGDRFGFSSLLEMRDLWGALLPRTTLIEARYMLSARTGERTLSPGLPAEKPVSYATAAGRVLSPTFAEKCLRCHGAPSPELRHTGVRCENCHGPGGLHIAAAGEKNKDLRIQNPGRLEAEQLLAVCAPCHAGFSPLVDPRPDDLLISSQVVALRSSACYQKSEGRLTCLNCHDPHGDAAHEDPRYEKACLSCHTASVRVFRLCSADKTSGCPECHMPVVRKADSFPLVDHWIRVVERPMRENIRALVARGAAMAERGELEGAIRHLESLLPSGSGEPSLHYNLGLAYEEAGRPDDALSSYRSAISVEPDLVAAHINLGSMLLAQKKTDEAIASFRRAVDINPLEASAHFNLAIAGQGMGDLDSVQQALRLAVAIDPRLKKILQVR